MNVLEELNSFYRSYEGVKGYIGSSEKGKPVYYFAVEKSAYPVVVAQYAIHAREYITTYLAMAQIRDFIARGECGTVYFVPAANPDGIEIALKKNPLYKANANGVDLNVNFDARWGTGRSNVFKKAPENYVGERPFSESETRALRDFTLFVRADATISYHSKGEEIYWEFGQNGKARARDFKIAAALSETTGYPLVKTGGSAGGYKDWCIESLMIPSFTIEVGGDELSHPILKESLSGIFEKNKNVIKVLTEVMQRE